MLAALAVHQPEAPPLPLANAVRRHAEAVVEALQAHVARQELPAYREIPWRDVAGVIDWHAPE